MRSFDVGRTLLVSATLLSVDGNVAAQAFTLTEEEHAGRTTPYSPFVSEHFPHNVYFGDTLLHTSWSADAGLAGATLGPDAAYRVARGEQIVSQSGQPLRLIRPLDFVVVADHAEKHRCGRLN